MALAGTSACSEDPPPTVSQEEYDEAAANLCTGMVAANMDAIDATALSDAEWVALVRTGFVPEMRAAVRRLQNTGFPVENGAEYAAALDQVMNALSEIDDEEEAYQYLDRSRRGAVPKDEDPLVRIDEGLAAADVDDC